MMLQTVKNKIIALHEDENGDIPVGSIMVIGLIAIPLVIALVTFRDELLGYLRERFTDFEGAESTSTF